MDIFYNLFTFNGQNDVSRCLSSDCSIMKLLVAALLITQIDKCLHLLYHSIVHVQRADSGEYRCRMSINSRTFQSQPITIEVEGEFQHCANIWLLLRCPHFSWRSFNLSIGLPTFIHQPEDRNVTRSKSFTLSCEAVGPPDPVQIRWLRDGLPDSDFHNSPSSYSVSGETTQIPQCLFFSTHTEKIVFPRDLLNNSYTASLLLPVSVEVVLKEKCYFLLFP